MEYLSYIHTFALNGHCFFTLCLLLQKIISSNILIGMSFLLGEGESYFLCIHIHKQGFYLAIILKCVCGGGGILCSFHEENSNSHYQYKNIHFSLHSWQQLSPRIFASDSHSNVISTVSFCFRTILWWLLLRNFICVKHTGLLKDSILDIFSNF